MTEKEFRKLRAKDLVQLLLSQGNEATRIQAQIDKKEEELAELLKNNELLKVKLDDSDEYIENLKKDLDFRDNHIRNLEVEMESLRNDLWIDTQEIGTLTEAVKLVNEIFEMVQREADQHMKYAREQGIDPSKVRMAKPDMPMTVMPVSVLRGSSEDTSGSKQYAAAVKEKQSEEPPVTAAQKKKSKAAERKKSKESLAAAVQKGKSKESPIAALQPEKSKESPIAAAQPEKSKEEPVSAVQPEKSKESPIAAIQPEKTKAAPAAAAEEKKSIEEPAAGRENEGAVREAPTAEAQAADVSETVLPERLTKAVKAAAVAIDETKASASADNNISELKIAGIDPEAIIPPAVQPDAQTAADALAASGKEMSEAAQEDGPSAVSDTLEPQPKPKGQKRGGLFGFLKTGKDKSKKNMDHYESSPVVARMKN